MLQNNIHGRPGVTIYVFNAETKKPHTTCRNLKEAAQMIQKTEAGVHYFARKQTPVNGFILSRTKELTEPIEKMFL